MGKTAVVILLLRTITGILFFFQGYDKLFKVKVRNVVQTFTESYKRMFPLPLLSLAVYLSSITELVAGLMLILGIFKVIALYALCVDLVLVTLAFSYMRPMWDMQLFFPRMIFVAALLLLSNFNDPFSLQHLLNLVK
jgi:putative oxidoreductase